MRCAYRPVLTAALSVALLMGAALSALAASEVDRPLRPLYLMGSLAAVNSGQMAPWGWTKLNPGGLAGSLGFGTTGTIGEMGEMVSFAGRSFIRTVTPEGVKVVEAKAPFRTPFAASVLADGDIFPRAYRMDADEPMLLHSMLEKLAIDAKSPIAVVGWVTMAQAEGTALKRAPVNGEAPVGENAVDTISVNDVQVAFYAVVIPPVTRPDAERTRLAALTMDAPEIAADAAKMHVHGAIVEEAAPADYLTSPLILDGLRNVHVKDVFHVSATSTVKRGVALIYRLQDAR